MFFSPFSIAITSLGEKRANLSAFRTFDRFVLVWICRFPLPLDVCPWSFLLPFFYLVLFCSCVFQSFITNGKNSGPDLLLNEFIKYGTDNLINHLHSLFNKIFDTGYFLDVWCDGYIVPLHQKGIVDNIEKYRGTALLSVLSKLFTTIFNNRLDG